MSWLVSWNTITVSSATWKISVSNWVVHVSTTFEQHFLMFPFVRNRVSGFKNKFPGTSECLPVLDHAAVSTGAFFAAKKKGVRINTDVVSLKKSVAFTRSKSVLSDEMASSELCKLFREGNNRFHIVMVHVCFG